MASLLSDEDFQRLQTQLIDLKTSNYSLEECNRNLHNEIGSLQQKLDVLESEHRKAQKTIFKSKKIKEVESLFQENKNLQLKLQSQEDEFRLQNMTLVEELSALLSGQDKLEKELQLARQQQTNKADEVHQNEIRRLGAENLALKKSMLESQQNHDRDVSKLKKALRDLMTPKESIVDTADDQSDTSAFEQSEKDDYEVVEVGEREVSYRKSCGSNSSALEYFQEIESKNEEEIRAQKEELARLKLLLDTEAEEKRMLQEEMEANQAKARLQIEKLELNASLLTEKLKKKQESLLQLQNEKELYQENNSALTKSQASKDLEIRQLQELSQRLQTQLQNAIQNMQEAKESICGDVEVGSQTADKLKSLEADRIVLQSQLADAKATIKRCRDENETLQRRLDDSFAQSESLVMRLSAIEENNSVLTTTLDNVQKTAEKRKVLLDEMAIHLQTKTDDHQREISKLVDEYTQQIESLSRKIEDEQAASVELEKCRSKIDDLEAEVQSLECTRGWFERRLCEAEESLQSANVHYNSTLSRQADEHEAKICQIQAEHEAKLSDLGTQLEIANAQKSEFEDLIAKSKQETKDALEDRKIHDKKGASIVKDLKRQLQIERKRVEGLQERFQELLNEPSHTRTAPAEPFKTVDVDRGETCSISSWSMMSGGGNSEVKESSKEDGSGITSLQNGNSPSPSTNVLEENEALVAKCVALQEGKSDLEERLSYLEESNAAMAQDIVEKTAIIQYYCMKKTSDPNVRAAVDKMTVKRVLDFIKDRGDENQRKINHRLQRILEEYLTKNMHLQKDLDALSKENEQLRETSGADSML